MSLGFGNHNKFVLRILQDYEADGIQGLDFAEFLKLSTAKLGDTGTRAEVERVFKHFDINKTVLFINKEGKNLSCWDEEGGWIAERELDRRRDWENDHQGRFWWRWIFDSWWFLQCIDQRQWAILMSESIIDKNERKLIDVDECILCIEFICIICMNNLVWKMKIRRMKKY